jgi:hypothetical protein
MAVVSNSSRQKDFGADKTSRLYIIEGVITVGVGIIIVFFLPDFPETWKALSPEMRHVALKRLSLDAAEADQDEEGGMSQLKGMKMAFADPKTYLLALMYFCITGAAGFQNFFPTLTKSLGYGPFVSLLLVAPPYLFMVFWSLFHSWMSDKKSNRYFFFIYPIPLAIIGMVIFMTTKGFGPRYFSFFLMMFVFTINGTQFAWISSSIPRPPAKRAAALAIMNALGNSTSIWTSFTYRPGDSHTTVLVSVSRLVCWSAPFSFLPFCAGTCRDRTRHLRSWRTKARTCRPSA